jgi:hypothetical protein
MIGGCHRLILISVMNPGVNLALALRCRWLAQARMGAPIRPAILPDGAGWLQVQVLLQDL